MAAGWRAILIRRGTPSFQSGPESTGYPKDLNFPPVLNIRPLDLSLRLESRGPICPKGLLQNQASKLTLGKKSYWKIGRFGCNSRQRLFCCGFRSPCVRSPPRPSPGLAKRLFSVHGRGPVRNRIFAGPCALSIVLTSPGKLVLSDSSDAMARSRFRHATHFRLRPWEF